MCSSDLLGAEVDHLTVVSEPERQAVIRMGVPAGRISVVPNGADALDLARPLASQEPDTAVYSGALSFSANYDAVRWLLAEIWPIVVRARPGARLVITGSTAGVDLSTLPSVPGVVFSGFVDDIKTLVATRAACVVPLRTGGGTRLKVLEALALGTPVVSTSKGGEGLDVQNGWHVLIADSPDAFAAAIVKVFERGEDVAGWVGEERELLWRGRQELGCVFAQEDGQGGDAGGPDASAAIGGFQRGVRRQAAPHDFAGEAEPIEQLRLVTGDAAREDGFFPRGGRDFVALQLTKDLQQTVGAVEARARFGVLPAGEEAHEVG